MTWSRAISGGSATSCTSSIIEENYTVVKNLGSGGFGQVSEVKEKTGAKKHFAWKQVSLEKDPYGENEVNLLRDLKHEGIVKIIEAHNADGMVDMVLELCNQGSMQEYIEQRFERVPMSYEKLYMAPEFFQITSCMTQLLEAIKFLHENCVAHRDVKPANVLLASGRRWKLADFGLATKFQPGVFLKSNVGTRPFQAPEVAQKCYTEKCDIYSTGILFIALTIGKAYSRPEDLESEEEKAAAVQLLDEKRWRNQEFPGQVGVGRFA
ncbi:unnamed protein product [Durusdinium trenchii]|uniref:Protein kinase domain-containing protein n=1 Tax=Durusdinium trenchii TaxID=1381693 RepID=A0ABP0MC67_9DINO